MKAVLTSLFVLVLVLASGGQVAAVPITFLDVTQFTTTGTNLPEDYVGHGWGSVNVLDGALDYVAWKHQFTFSPPAAEVLAGALTVVLQDNERDRFLIPTTWEFGVGWTESGQWDFGAVDSGSYSYDITVGFLTDGLFNVVLASLGGDFSIVSSTLEVTYAPVPEPTTMILLGTGLLAFAAFRKRFM